MPCVYQLATKPSEVYKAFIDTACCDLPEQGRNGDTVQCSVYLHVLRAASGQS